MTWMGLCVELRILGANIKNSVAQANWFPGFVHWLNGSFLQEVGDMLVFFFRNAGP